ncbi:MAG TPA: DUF4388 domain-containing protein [Longimicrobiales bacterium]|nr:DUF4388 domain-containing protein [Longimicrobiales bacterium]
MIVVRTARLDRILEELGYVTDEQIRAGLRLQRTRGARLGECLIELGFLTPHQLIRALSKQFDLPWRPLGASDVPEDLRNRIPDPGPAGSIAIPVRWDASERVLTVALNDPRDTATLDALRTGFGAERLILELAPDRDLREVRAALASRAPVEDGIVELPELFGPGAERGASADERGDGRDAGEGGPLPRVVMVTGRAHTRAFLASVFAREGRELVVVSSLAELESALGDGPIEAILVGSEISDTFRGWVRSGQLAPLPAEVTTFPSVSDALIGNPAPYGEVVRSLRAAVEALADSRTRGRDPPPYGVLARDVEALARLDGLSRLAVDGLHLAVHLLVPPAPEAPDGRALAGPFADFARSREIAVRLRFPWPIEELLDTCFSLFLGARAPDLPGRLDPEILQGARILALVWYHHILAPPASADQRDDTLDVRASLRRAAARLATLELAEKYIGLLEERRAAGEVGETAQVILVGGDRIADLGARLARSKIRPIVTRDLADAQAMAERQPPAAIIVDREAVHGKVEQFARIAKLDAALLLYVVTESSDPAVTLALLDAGADDVFSPPHDFHLAAARIVRAIASRSRVRSAARPRAGEFSAAFQAFSFLDLVQALANGRKSVRIELRRPATAEEARLYLDRGTPVHATCNGEVGPEAVYRVIAWGDDGEFTVYPESDFPPPTITLPLESLLMEGCRRLDESLRDRRASIG